ncbi:MAG: PIN domain-containing protein [Micropruina sp.]|uniref:type II toxin-antitoxin system VapC family toxin n=1 Tax=Micropruina sp. TaxID=2737536 RepID=UPI0039E61F8F
MIVLDANVLIAHFAIRDTHSARALELLDTEEELAIHPITLAEVLTHPARDGRADLYREQIAIMGVQQLPVAVEQPLALAKLRASTSLKLPDCCVLAAAMETGATLATFDTTLAKSASEHGVSVAQ